MIEDNKSLLAESPCLNKVLHVFKSMCNMVVSLLLVSFTLALQGYFFDAYCLKFTSLELK